ncbi:hypothetical protein DF186_23070, partial [Enterococcus hirae]
YAMGAVFLGCHPPAMRQGRESDPKLEARLWSDPPSLKMSLVKLKDNLWIRRSSVIILIRAVDPRQEMSDDVEPGELLVIC